MDILSPLPVLVAAIQTSRRILAHKGGHGYDNHKMQKLDQSKAIFIIG